jgi:hypothetical protein
VYLLDPALFQLVFQNRELNLRIYEVNNPLPRAYFTSHWRWAASRQSVLDSIASEAKNVFDPAQTTYLEGDAPAQARHPGLETSESGTPGSGTSGSSPSVQSQPIIALPVRDSISQDQAFEIVTKKPGVVVVADQFFPGWEATIDGKPTELLRANAFQRAVFVEPGSHTIYFAYRPFSLRIALYLAAAGYVGLIVLGVLGVCCTLQRRAVMKPND